jgi:protein-S-isoprenylcysteine O-methyltransferase Ste14
VLAAGNTPSQKSDLQQLQRKRKLALTIGVGACLLLLAATQSVWRVSAPQIYHLVERAGLLLILLCIAGRTWCTLYIGGHKKRELVAKGPYSIARNPLYVFTLIGAAGIGAQSGSIVIAVLFAAAAFAIFLPLVRQEEAFLVAAFPLDFPAYTARVPRFFPRWSAWEEANELIVKPHLVRRTFFDASLFLLALPVATLIDWAQEQHLLPVIVHLV